MASPHDDRLPPTRPGSATLSLLDLRRHLLRRAGELIARARALRARGDSAGALRIEEQSQRLLQVARSMRPEISTPVRGD
jgi:hypothetical protein